LGKGVWGRVCMLALIVSSIDWVIDWINKKQTRKVVAGSREGVGRVQDWSRGVEAWGAATNQSRCNGKLS